MSTPAHARMTADQFIEWAMAQPEGERYELAAGEVVAMAPERSAHALTKLAVAMRLVEAVRTGKLPCTVYPDGMAIQVDANTVYEPDALVRCGSPLPPDAIRVTDPLIVVEVLSPSTRARDAGAKLEDYFRLPTMRHYLILKTENRSIVHHRRDDAGGIETRIVRDGPLLLDPPGIELRDLFPD